jgi:ubiquitin-conjugating enzyme E2 S
MSGLSVSAVRAVMRQIQDINNSPIDGIALNEPGDELSVVEADIKGPEDTPFYGGTFHVVLHLPENYPEVPPKGFFKTKLFHPNVSDKGEICVNTLKKDWEPSLGLRHILTVIRCLLIEPNPESALNEEAGRLLLEEYAEYVKKARMYTGVHAMALRNVENANINTSSSSQQAQKQLGVSGAPEKKLVDKKKAALKRLWPLCQTA